MVKSVGQIIFDDLAKSGIFERLTSSQCVYEVLKHVLGDLSAHLKILAFKNGTVWVGSPNPIISQELSFMEDEIVKRVNEIIGQPLVKRIRFKGVI